MSTSHYSNSNSKPPLSRQRLPPDDRVCLPVDTTLERERRREHRARQYLECAWLAVLTLVLVAADAAGLVYFFGGWEWWIFVGLLAVSWTLAVALLNKLKNIL